MRALRGQHLEEFQLGALRSLKRLVEEEYGDVVTCRLYEYGFSTYFPELLITQKELRTRQFVVGFVGKSEMYIDIDVVPWDKSAGLVSEEIADLVQSVMRDRGIKRLSW